jgi:uracil phosphoribosyltransferase
MKQSLLTILRDKKSSTSAFRRAADTIARSLALEAAEYITEQTVRIATPVARTTGFRLKEQIVLIPILRSGLALLPSFLELFDEARVGFIGLKRDEKTAVAHEYYRNIPRIAKKDTVMVLDPMIATGGSAIETVRAILASGAKESQIITIFLIGAPEGLQRFKTAFPDIKIVIGTVDEKLNKNNYIVPGLGDFGDRYFGTV